MNQRMENLMYHAGLTAQGSWDAMDTYDQQAIEKFAQLLIEHVMTKIEAQIGVAYGEGDIDTAVTLEALAIDILEDFDIELPEEND